MVIESIGDGYLVSFHFDAMVVRYEIENMPYGEVLGAIDDLILMN